MKVEKLQLDESSVMNLSEGPVICPNSSRSMLVLLLQHSAHVRHFRQRANLLLQGLAIEPFLDQVSSDNFLYSSLPLHAQLTRLKLSFGRNPRRAKSLALPDADTSATRPANVR